MSFFSSRRSTVHGLNGGVASSQPLASQVGIEILQKGGNAVDAAVSMAIALNAVEPMSTGIGGDIFSLIWDPKSEQVHSFNGSGQSSRNSDPNDTTVVIDNLENGTTYYFRMSAIDYSGLESEKTLDVSATPIPQKYEVNQNSAGDFISIQSAINQSLDDDLSLIHI